MIEQAVEPRLEQEPDQVGPDHAGPADDEKDQREHRRVHPGHRLEEGAQVGLEDELAHEEQ